VKRARVSPVPLLSLAVAFVPWGRAPRPVAGPASTVCRALRPELYRIPLVPTDRARGAEGTVRVRFASTPFGIAVTAEGHPRYELDVSVGGLPVPQTYGAYTRYVAWVAKSDLSEVAALGAVDDSGHVSGSESWHKFTVVVTAEPAADAPRWTGPILLRGISASVYLQNFANTELFMGGMPPC
jgi:hypothetical protein